MKNVTRHKGILKIEQVLKPSVFGNSRYLVSLDGYTAKTSVDSMDGINCKAYDGKLVEAQIGLHYGVRTIQYIKLIRSSQRHVIAWRSLDQTKLKT